MTIDWLTRMRFKGALSFPLFVRLTTTPRGLALMACCLIPLVVGCTRRTPRALEIPVVQGWTTISLPQDYGRYALAGALIRIRARGRIDYVGPLSTCGVDSVALRPERINVAYADSYVVNVKSASRDSLSFLGTVNVSAVRTLADKLVVRTTNPVGEMVVEIKVARAVQASRSDVLKNCGRYFQDRDVFWVSQAIRASGFVMTFTTANDDTIKGQAALRKILTGSHVGSDSIGSNGRISVPLGRSVYVAFQEAAPAALLVSQRQLTEEQRDNLRRAGDLAFIRGPGASRQLIRAIGLFEDESDGDTRVSVIWGGVWATVYIDDKRSGSTPLDIAVTSGPHKIILRDAYNRPVCSETILVPPGKTLHLECNPLTGMFVRRYDIH